MFPLTTTLRSPGATVDQRSTGQPAPVTRLPLTVVSELTTFTPRKYPRTWLAVTVTPSPCTSIAAE